MYLPDSKSSSSCNLIWEPPYMSAKSFDTVAIPKQCILQDNLIYQIFPEDLQQDDIKNRVLTPKNQSALQLNNDILLRQLDAI